MEFHILSVVAFISLSDDGGRERLRNDALLFHFTATHCTGILSGKL